MPSAVLCLLLLHCACVAPFATPRVRGSTDGTLRHICSATKPVVLLDGNNMRGCALFSRSYAELSEATTRWAEAHGLTTLLVLDHGPEQRAWETGALSAVALSGGGQTADDVMVRDAQWLARTGQHVFVVSSDQGLAARARRRQGAAATRVEVLSSYYVTQMILGEEERPPNKKEKTAERVAAAEALAAALDAAAQPPSATETVVTSYVRWYNEEAPRGRRHTDPPGLPSPSTKRSLRRKRARAAAREAASL